MMKNNGSGDYPLELTVKGYSRSNQALASPAKSTGHVHNLMVCFVDTSLARDLHVPV